MANSGLAKHIHYRQNAPAGPVSLRSLTAESPHVAGLNEHKTPSKLKNMM